MKYPNFKDLILFENDDYIVVNKPPFVASLDERGGSGEVNILRLAKQYSDDAQVCHRLDKETSGAIIIAKTPDAYRNVAIQFEKRRVNKVYHAIVDGQFTFDQLFIDLPILNDGNKSVTIDRKEGKRAETIFTTLKHYRHYTLVECKPITGRMHQIRIHLATQRAAIVGDHMYKGKDVFLSSMKKSYKIAKNDEEQPLIKRFALHARFVTFKGMDDQDIFIDAPYPKDFATLIKLLDKFDG
ncbi:MAG: RNA pseudouridine synthase [Bacteroidota bacterium]